MMPVRSQPFMLRVLYFVIGNALRCNFKDKPRHQSSRASLRVETTHPHPDIQLWQTSVAVNLLADPSLLDYDLWMRRWLRPERRLTRVPIAKSLGHILT